MAGLTNYYNDMWRDYYIPPYVTSLFPLMDSLKLTKNSRVMDVACGNGIIGKYLIDRFQCRIWGTDISEVALKHCEKLGYITELVNLDQESLPFEGEQFDLVILSAMIEHVMEPEKIINMAYQKLAPGGYAVILTPNIEWCVNRFLFLMGRWDHRLMGGMKGHISYRNKKQLREMIIAAGFQSLDWNYSVLCTAGTSDFCTKGISGWLIQKVHNTRVRFWHSLFAFNFIISMQKPI